MKKIALILLILLLSACNAESPGSQTPPENTQIPEKTDEELEKYVLDIFAMDTFMSVAAYGPSAESALEKVADEIRAMDKQLSVTDEESEIYAVNNDGGAQVAVSPETAEIISESLAICARTGGALDISIYPVVRAWGFTTDAPAVPEDGVIAALLGTVDYRQINLDGDNLTVPDGMMIDLGAVAKGFLSDRISAILKDAGVEHALIDLGGNIQTLGTKPGGERWRVGVRDPENPQGMLGVAEIADMAAITSGGYERYFEQDGETYWHIIDPATGNPAESGIISVTVIGKSGMLCDALSTALFIMGVDKAMAHYGQYGDFEAVLVTQAGEVYITPGLVDSFTLAEGTSYKLMQ